MLIWRNCFNLIMLCFNSDKLETFSYWGCRNDLLKVAYPNMATDYVWACYEEVKKRRQNLVRAAMCGWRISTGMERLLLVLFSHFLEKLWRRLWVRRLVTDLVHAILLNSTARKRNRLVDIVICWWNFYHCLVLWNQLKKRKALRMKNF